MRAGHILIDALDQNSQALKLPDTLGPREAHHAGKFLFAQEAILDRYVTALENKGVGIPYEAGSVEDRKRIVVDVRRRKVDRACEMLITMVNIHESKIEPDAARVDYPRGKRLMARVLVD